MIRFFSSLYFWLVRLCLRLLASPYPVRIERLPKNGMRLFIFLPELTPRQRKILEIRFNRYRSLFWGGWNLIFAADMPLLQQTMNSLFAIDFVGISGLQPSRLGNDSIEAAVFLLQQLRPYGEHEDIPAWRRRQWNRYFLAAKLEVFPQISLHETLFRFMASILQLTPSQEENFFRAQREILAGRWDEMEPWKLAPLLQENPHVWCWWLGRFPFDWTEPPPWTETQKQILFAVVRWEIARALLTDWKIMSFADELRRLEVFLVKSFANDPSEDFQRIKTQLQAAQTILNSKNNSLLSP
jgi:hypothetical protein